MRLIDADELMNVILRSKKLNSECVLEQNAIDTYDNGQKETFELAIKMLDKQPTAYDVEKVVEQLENLEPFHVDGYGDDFVNLYDAIEIVMQDNVGTDDVCEWKKYDYKTICSPHERDWSIPAMKDFKWCPYCRKKIKVVE